jgi:DNA-directed RNA polymerase specialized sigma24 family protein
MMVCMTPAPNLSDYADTFQELREVRAAALQHAIEARRLSAHRRDIINQLIQAGFSQADIAREMGVTRQAVQKMLAL